MKIATWNVNSIRARLPRVIEWLMAEGPDIVLLQETKVLDEAFPAIEIEDLGYNIATFGQKTYNGVAILSKRPIEDIKRGLPGDHEDFQARYIEATIDKFRVASLYLPNGNPIGSEKFAYKLAWMRRLIDHARNLLISEETFVLGGDYNICPSDIDCFNPIEFQDDALCRPETRAKYRELIYLGLTDAYRALLPSKTAYSYWDYTRGSWQKDNGLRIDHLILAPSAADLLVTAGIDRSPRGKERPSDHTPVWCELSESVPKLIV